MNVRSNYACKRINVGPTEFSTDQRPPPPHGKESSLLTPLILLICLCNRYRSVTAALPCRKARSACSLRSRWIRTKCRYSGRESSPASRPTNPIISPLIAPKPESVCTVMLIEGYKTTVLAKTLFGSRLATTVGWVKWHFEETKLRKV